MDSGRASPLALTLSTASHALAPGDKERGFRERANHHVGDDSFAAFYGRLPGPADDEHLRMHAHFTHVRHWLGTRDATKPEPATRTPPLADARVRALRGPSARRDGEQEELAGSNGQGEELTRFYARFLEEHSISHGNPT